MIELERCFYFILFVYHFQEIGGGPQRPPPASKEVVAKLPIITVTDDILVRLGSETECAVCREEMVINDKMQELPCKHLFHPDCLKPWLVISFVRNLVMYFFFHMETYSYCIRKLHLPRFVAAVFSMVPKSIQYMHNFIFFNVVTISLD